MNRAWKTLQESDPEAAASMKAELVRQQLDLLQNSGPTGGKFEVAGLIAGFHRERLQVQQQVCELEIGLIGEPVEFVAAGRREGSPSARTIQHVNSFATACCAVKPQSSDGNCSSSPKVRLRWWRSTISSSWVSLLRRFAFPFRGQIN